MFPSVEELNKELNYHKESINPDHCKHQVLEISASINNIAKIDHLSQHSSDTSNLCGTTTASFLLSKIITSEDRLFFINRENKGRTEWTLVQVDLQTSLEQNPSLAIDCKYFVHYYIQHPDDETYNHINKRYWKEYHQRLGTYQLHEQFHLVKPDRNEHTFCKAKNLVPYAEWIYLNNTKTIICGPFEFATIDERKTKDRISEKQINAIIKAKDKYDNDPPVLCSRAMSIHLDTSYYSTHSNKNVDNRIQNTNAQSYLLHR